MMSIKRCKLSKKHQRKLVEFFVLEVTARSAGNMLGIQANTAALFYRKLRELIAYRLEEEWPFDGEVEIDESYFGGERKGIPNNVAVGDTFNAIAGCDKTISTCVAKFNNAVNFRGEPYVPGMDKMLATAATANDLQRV